MPATSSNRPHRDLTLLPCTATRVAGPRKLLQFGNGDFISQLGFGECDCRTPGLKSGLLLTQQQHRLAARVRHVVLRHGMPRSNRVM